MKNPSVNQEVTFEYQVIPEWQQQQVSEVYFQSRVEYVHENKRLLRVVTTKQPVSYDKDAVEKEANVDLIHKRVNQHTSYLALNNKNHLAEKYCKIQSTKMRNCNNYV